MKALIKFFAIFVAVVLLSNIHLLAEDNGDREIHINGEKVMSIVTDEGTLDVYNTLFYQDDNNQTHVSLIFVLNNEDIFPVTVTMDESENVSVAGAENIVNALQNYPEISQQIETQVKYYENRYEAEKKSALRCALGWAELIWGIITHRWDRIINGIYNILCGCYNHCI